jgi:type IV pilus assembly protein PilE
MTNHSLFRRRRQRGFTLIELMIAVAIVGILLAIAVPAYNEQTRRARRGTVKADMLETVQALERWNTANGTFVGFPTAAIPSPDAGTPAYLIVPGGLTITGYTLTATPQGDQVDDACGTITLNQTGEPTFSAAGMGKADCWNR